MHFIVFSSSSLFVKQTRSYRHCDSGFKEWDSMLYNGEVKWSEVAQLCPTLCDSVNCSLPGSSIHGIFQAGVLEWDAISLSRGSSWPRDQTQASRTVGRRFTVWATREAFQKPNKCQSWVLTHMVSDVWEYLRLFLEFSLVPSRNA